MDNLRHSRTQGKRPRRGDSGRTSWLMALGVAVAGVVVIVMVARVGGRRRGPLESFSPSQPFLKTPHQVAASRKLGQFETEMVTRTGRRWRLKAGALSADASGLHLDHPVMVLLNGARTAVHLSARQAHVDRAHLTLHLEGQVIFTMQADLKLQGENLTLAPNGRMHGLGAFTLSTAHGASHGEGMTLDPATGRIVLSPGTAAEEMIQWTGWGRDLWDLCETYSDWARTALLDERAVFQAAGPSS